MSFINVGYDASGNGNNWTSINIDENTTGVNADVLVDVPTPWGTDTGVGGEVRGNYGTWNPLRPNASMSYANGNLEAISSGGSGRSGYGTFGMSSGKWYFETTGGDNSVGIANISESVSATYSAAGSYNLNGTTVSGKATYTTTDIIGCAYDATSGTIEFFKNGVSQGSSSFSAGLGLDMVAQFNGTFSATRTCVANFGQRPFAYAAPTGFKALCTTNLPDPAIADGSQYMDVDLWTGNGTGQSITTPFAPDFVWIKARNQTYDNQVWDILRGPLIKLATNQTAAESSIANSVTSFNSNGYTLGDTATVNLNTGSFVGWAWKAGGTGVTNTAGTITSTVSANPTAGFSIVTFTSQASGTGTFGHGLGIAPSLILLKTTGVTGGWNVYHKSLGATKYLLLQTTDGEAASATRWNDTEPTSSVVTLGTNAAGSYAHVAYCFAPVEGYSAFGKYTGNGSADGPFVYTGFRPNFWMTKRTDTTSSWLIVDGERNTYNVVDDYLVPNSSAAEGSANVADFLSNGVKLRSTTHNDSGGTFIYAAFAENPFKYALAR